MAVLGHLTEREPPLGRKVDRFGAVESEVEARVVALRVGQDELAGELCAAVQGDAVVREDPRRREERLVAQELRAFRTVRREEACGSSVQP